MLNTHQWDPIIATSNARSFSAVLAHWLEAGTWSDLEICVNSGYEPIFLIHILRSSSSFGISPPALQFDSILKKLKNPQSNDSTRQIRQYSGWDYSRCPTWSHALATLHWSKIRNSETSRCTIIMTNFYSCVSKHWVGVLEISYYSCNFTQSLFSPSHSLPCLSLAQALFSLVLQ